MNDYLESARAVESLRIGVPNNKAVALLGCSQPRITKRFEAALDRVSKNSAAVSTTSGMLVKGGFGSGKSHTLSFLADLAAQRGFVVSRVSINKETPLSDPDKLFRALADSAVLPDRSGAGLFEAGQKLNSDGEQFRKLEQWANETRGLDARFWLSLRLFRLGRRRFEMRDQLLRFWCGDPLSVSYVKSQFRELGIPHAGAMDTCHTRDLGFQRPKFASRLLRAAGYIGWVWLIDEVELIGSYSILQRMRSYAQIGHLLGDDAVLDCPGVVTVLTITEDFDTAVIRKKQDLTTMPPYFRERCRMGLDESALPPQAGIGFIQTSGVLLDSLGEADADDLHTRLRQLYRAAYSWEPPIGNGLAFVSSTTVRERIKRWLTTWDLQRLMPTADVKLEAHPPDYNYDEPLPGDDGAQPNDEALVDQIMRELQ